MGPRASSFLETIGEGSESSSTDRSPLESREDSATLYSDPFIEGYELHNIDGYQGFFTRTSRRSTDLHIPSPEAQPDQQHNNDDDFDNNGKDDLERDILLNEAVRFRLERLRLQRELPKKPSILLRRASQAEKAYRVKELRRIRHCERRIEEKAEDLMAGLLKCHELCGVGLGRGKVGKGKEVIRLSWYES